MRTHARARARYKISLWDLAHEQKHLDQSSLCQLVAPMGTTWWYINFILPVWGFGPTMVYACARALQDLCPRNLDLESRMQFESLKEVTIRVKSPKESIKTLSKHPSPFLFEILALLGLCDMFHVTNGGLNFGWLSGHKSWTQGPNWSNLVANESSHGGLSYKTIWNIP